MFEEMIEQIRGYCLDSDVKTCSKLQVEQFGNLLCILSDKGLVDDTSTTKDIHVSIMAVYESLESIIGQGNTSRKLVRAHNKLYSALVNAIRLNYQLEPKGSIQGRMMALGIAIGAGVGTALSTINPAMISVGIGAGVAIGISIGKKKEKEAEDEGRLF